jgi:hypothetical protein
MDRTTEDSAISTEDNTGVQDQSSPVGAQDLEVDPKTKAFVEDWTKKIKRGKTRHETAFKRMRQNMKLAKDGHDEAWGDEKYSVPIITRQINVAVAQLYAKNPTALAKRKRRRMFTVWDGQIASLEEAGKAIAAAQQMMQPPDPNHVAIIEDAEQVKTYDTMVDGIADTLTLLTQHFVDDPAAMYKQQFKALVRRTKVCGVGYIKLAFERALEPTPDARVKIDTMTAQVNSLRQLISERSREQFDEDSAESEQLKTLLADIQAQPSMIVKEGPVFAFPKSTRIIIDPECFHLKTLAGAGWYAEEWDMTPAKIEKTYKVDVRGHYTQYKPETKDTWQRPSDGDVASEECGKVWRVMNRDTGQEFTICEGYPNYLKPPAEPDVKLERFWDIFPVVFNEIEDEKDIFPPSDVYAARHSQAEYNRSREGLREHRQQNRPGYFAGRGSFEEKDLEKIQTHGSGEVMLLNQLSQGEKIADKLQAKPVMQIDPKMYDVTEIWNDILRVVGTQQADVGTTTSSTATESAIAEQGRSTSAADVVDDIDDVLGLLFHSTGELMLREMSVDMVKEIVGPGAIWPTLEETREQIIKTVILNVKGGSSGRPNQAANLAKMERAMPHLIQLPGVNPVPLIEKYLGELDIDAENTIVEGLPSIVAMNTMLQRMNSGAPGQPQPGTGNPQTDPNAQGPQGAQNAPQQPGQAPGPQPAMPAPIHFDIHGNPMNGAA